MNGDVARSTIYGVYFLKSFGLLECLSLTDFNASDEILMANFSARAINIMKFERLWLGCYIVCDGKASPMACCCFGFSGRLRQYFSLYPAVSQREREKEERGDRGE